MVKRVEEYVVIGNLENIFKTFLNAKIMYGFGTVSVLLSCRKCDVVPFCIKSI